MNASLTLIANRYSSHPAGNQLMNPLLFQSASSLARQIRNETITSTELIEASITRIKAINPSINAVVQLVEERALDEAKERDNELKLGIIKGPLHGVPISLKDSIDTQGIITTGGTQGRKNHIPTHDAPVANRLRAAGAVLIAKTNTPELTLSGETCNDIYGRTRNPYDLNLSPGGSSGGSAALIASGGSALELGSDTGGSIREPAHFCGIAGLKPTQGRVPRTGHIIPWGLGALDSLTQIGPMARYVEDLALALPIISGMDWQDPSVVPMPTFNGSEVDLSQCRVAMFCHNSVVKTDNEISMVIKQVADSLSNEGCRVIETLPDAIPEAIECLIALRENLSHSITQRLLDNYGTTKPGAYLDYCFKTNLPQTATINNQLLERIDKVKSQILQFMSNYDAILCPPSHTLARVHDASLDDELSDWSYVTLFNLLGYPAATVRAGISQSGLPIGVQIAAAPWREDIALALAEKIELMHGGFKPPII